MACEAVDILKDQRSTRTTVSYYHTKTSTDCKMDWVVVILVLGKAGWVQTVTSRRLPSRDYFLRVSSDSVSQFMRYLANRVDYSS